MTLTAQQAIERLPGITTKEELRMLINQLDITATGTTTILYSGETASGVQTNDIIQAMLRNGEDIRVIGTTEAAKFLNVDPNVPACNEEFLNKLYQLIGGDPGQPGTKSYQFMYGEHAADGTRIPNGVWDDASARFVDATEGEIRTLTAGANVNRTFYQTELTHALKNSKISSIDGIPIADLRKMGNANAFKAISAQSDVYSSQLIVAVKSNGEFIRTIDEYLLLDSRGFFKATGLEGKPPLLEMVRNKNLAEFMPNRITQHDQGRIILNDIAKYYREQSRLSGAENVTLRISAYLAYLIWLGNQGQGQFGLSWGITLLCISAGAVTAIPLLLFNGATNRLPLTLIGLLQYITPTIQFSIGVWYFNEDMPAARWTGFFIIWIALLALTIDLVKSGRAIDHSIT